MAPYPLIFAALLAGPAQAQVEAGADTGDTGGDCSTWGDVTPEQRTVNYGEYVTFRIGGGPSCGDVESCTWWSDGDAGDFQQTSGSPVTWRAPSDYKERDCVSLELRVWAACTDGNTTGSSDVTVNCKQEQLDEVQKDRSATLTGGGCSGPPTLITTSAAALLLVPGLGFLRRRRD